jgi:hypothetical protein
MDTQDYRNNTGIESRPDSRIAQGDFPEKIQSLETRPSHLEPELNREGSIDAGTSFEQGLYDVDQAVQPDEGMDYVF